jgi:hypothetical protein
VFSHCHRRSVPSLSRCPAAFAGKSKQEAAVSILDLFVIHRGTPRQVVIVFLVRCAMA